MQRSSPRSIADAIRAAAELLARAGHDTPRLDAEVLLRHVLGIDRTQLFARMRDLIAAADLERFELLVARRAAHEPVAYLTGVREFMGLPFSVGPGVLIPRPETELLVEWALAWLATRSTATIVDVGTGSGAMIVSLAAALESDRGDLLVGGDLSSLALDYAKRNAAALAPGRVNLVLGDLLSWCGRPVDLILANLPYLTPAQHAGNRDLAAEPSLALVSGAQGLDAIARLIADLPRTLAAGGAVGLELDPGQASWVHDRLRVVLPGANLQIIRDLAQRDRFVVAVKA